MDNIFVTSSIELTLFSALRQEVVEEVTKTVLSQQHYCVVLDPVDSKGRNQLGKKELRQGISSFFLHPGTYSSQ